MSQNDPCAPIWAPHICKHLVDYLMPIGNTGVGYVAKLPAILRIWGPEFTAEDRHQAELRAASTLAQTALIRGMSLQFLRLAIPWDEATTAAFFGITVPELQAYEAEAVPLPRDVWVELADYVAKLDGRSHYECSPPNPAENWQPRFVRVYPDFPQKSNNKESPPGCTPC